MSAVDELRAACDRVADDMLAAYEDGHQTALKAVMQDFLGRHNDNPKLRMRPESIVAVIQSHRRPHPTEGGS